MIGMSIVREYTRRISVGRNSCVFICLEPLILDYTVWTKQTKGNSVRPKTYISYGQTTGNSCGKPHKYSGRDGEESNKIFSHLFPRLLVCTGVCQRQHDC